ncbi:MAG TPA: hypothetical protein VFX12_01640 [Vicinamibacterales bacterium]|nr:hypothetical protein [Vicinamibacterales bacterium]
MLKTLLMTCSVLAVATLAGAQAPKPKEPPDQKAPARQEAVRTPASQARPVNIKIDLTIVDQTGPSASSQKTVSMIVADQQRGMIRTLAFVRTPEGNKPIEINVDAHPTIMKDDLISVQFTLQYQPHPASAEASRGGQTDASATTAGGAAVTEMLGLLLESGKEMVISQAADPITDRKVTVGVTATILR